MQTVIIKGYTVTIFKLGTAQEIIITDANGNKTYGARMAKNDSALNRAHSVIEKL